MMNRFLAGAVAALAMLLIAHGTGLRAQSASTPPLPPREFRGVWVATVDNIDWPSSRKLTTEQQKEEMIRILDTVRKLRMNAVVFQVRPACDALYESSLEPWSGYLTGTVGRAPEPAYDPLAFAVEEAHRRGIELHAWFNPYRASHPGMRGSLPRNHIVNTRPDLARKFGEYYWLDPGEPDVMKHVINVIVDVVRRYDVDGVHFDDYFYPYKSYGKGAEFPDQKTYARYKAGGGRLSLDDWRRENVNQLVQYVGRNVHAAKPWVRFGVSPFGIWRPGNPSGITGLDAYSSLYADARKWLAEGWIDYLAPQLYWKIGQKGQDYRLLLKWWAEQNVKGRHVWPGLGAHLMNEKRAAWPASEIAQQIGLARDMPSAGGTILFSMKVIAQDTGGIQNALAGGPFRGPAIPPAATWLDNTPPAPPAGLARAPGETSQVLLTWQAAGQEPVRLWTVYIRIGGQWRMDVIPGGQTRYPIVLQQGAIPDAVAVAAVDRCGNESQRSMLSLAR